LSDIQAWEIAQMSHINVENATTSITKEAFGKRLLNTLIKNSDGDVNKDKFMADYENVCSRKGFGNHLNSSQMAIVASEMNRLGHENLTEDELTTDISDWIDLRNFFRTRYNSLRKLSDELDEFCKNKFHKFDSVLHDAKEGVLKAVQEVGIAKLKAEDIVDSMKKNQPKHTQGKIEYALTESEGSLMKEWRK